MKSYKNFHFEDDLRGKEDRLGSDKIIWAIQTCTKLKQIFPCLQMNLHINDFSIFVLLLRSPTCFGAGTGSKLATIILIFFPHLIHQVAHKLINFSDDEHPITNKIEKFAFYDNHHYLTARHERRKTATGGGRQRDKYPPFSGYVISFYTYIHT